MKFSSREDIDVPIAFVFERVCDFPMFEKQAVKRGAKVKRVDSGEYKVGSAWDASFKYRGRKRDLNLKIEELQAPETLALHHESSGIYGDTVIELIALSPKKTRIIASIELRPKTMPARLLIQSLKLAKATLTSRFKKRLNDFSSSVSVKYAQSANA